MTDLELLEQTALAMGFELREPKGKVYRDGIPVHGNHHDFMWNPLANDQDAFVLIKQFRMQIAHATSLGWSVHRDQHHVWDNDLNRAVTVCAASK